MRAGSRKTSERTSRRNASQKAGKAICSALASFARKPTGSVERCEFEAIDRDYFNRFNRKVREKGRPISNRGRFGGPDRLARVLKRKDGSIIKRKDGTIAVTNRFPVHKGTVLYGGRAEPLGFNFERGTVVDGSVYINYGQRKKMMIKGDEEEVVYVISAHTTNRAEGASGWIKVKDVIDHEERLALDKMPDLTQHQQREFKPGPPCVISGGDPDLYRRYKRKVRPCVSDANIDARDYLRRTPDFASPLGYVNLLYNLPGSGSISADTLPVGTTFVPIPYVKPVGIALYRPHSPHRVSGNDPLNEMQFVYGYARTPGTNPPHRYGWIALDALRCPPDS